MAATGTFEQNQRDAEGFLAPFAGAPVLHLVGSDHLASASGDTFTNRWGNVRAATPEKTMLALEQVLPEKYWIEINRLLVPFGKHICTGERPKCSTCPVLDMCQQVGVTSHR